MEKNLMENEINNKTPHELVVERNKEQEFDSKLDTNIKTENPEKKKDMISSVKAKLSKIFGGGKEKPLSESVVEDIRSLTHFLRAPAAFDFNLFGSGKTPFSPFIEKYNLGDEGHEIVKKMHDLSG